jgi:predicted permease
MEMSQPNISFNPEPGSKSVDQLQQQVEDRWQAVKTDVTQHPFLYLAIAFVTGVVSNTFPARILFLIVMRIISWLLGPAILLLGVFKLSDLFSGSRRTTETTVLLRPN